MKIQENTLALLVIGLLLFTAFRPLGNNPIAPAQESLRTIEVIGSAELSLEPSEQTFTIRYREYGNPKSRYASEGMNLESVEAKVIKALDEVGIKQDCRHFSSFNTWHTYWYWYNYHNEPYFYHSKSLDFKVSSMEQMDQLVKAFEHEKLDHRAIESISQGQPTHEDLEKYRGELKLQALKNAKIKASLLLNGIDESAGRLIQVAEIDAPQNQNGYYGSWNQSFALSNSSYAINSGNQENPGMKPIKLRYEVKAIFEID